MKPLQMKQTLCAAALLASSALFMAPAVMANSWVETVDASSRTKADIVRDQSVMLRTASRFKELRVADAAIADVLVLTDQSFQVMGKARGKTNVMLYDEKNRLIDVVDVNVGYDLAGLKRDLYETFPNDRIEVRPMADGIYLSGEVNEVGVSQRANNIALAYAPGKVTNGLVVRDSHQVLLEVRFVEATRDAVKSLGIGLLTQQAGDFAFINGVPVPGASFQGIIDASIGNASVDVQIEALEEKGIIRTLAEPNLVSMSGETASFLAGGEFPVPVQAELGQITIEFRQFGVGLAFTPTVLDDGIINLKVAPEVSQLDTSNSVRVGGVEVPALRVRRANTTIELRNSQSFAIAGLLQNETTNRNTQAPWIGDIPILGSLFRSSRYQQAETELVIIVTPKLVQPVSDISKLKTPTDPLTVPNDVEQFLLGRTDGSTEAVGEFAGEYGYVVQ